MRLRFLLSIPPAPLLLALAVLLSSSPPAAAQQQVEGWFHTVWGIQERTPGVNVQFLLTDDGGRTYRLRVDERVMAPWGGPLALDRKRVTVTGHALASTAAGLDERVFDVAAITPREPAAAPAAGSHEVHQAPQFGSKPYVTLLCRFADSTSVMPKSKAYYEGLLTGSAYPGLDHYWRELSDGRINLAGSRVAGWYDLPEVKAAYFEPKSDGTPDLARIKWGKVVTDCTGRADADVDFRQYTGINLQLNGGMSFSWGGSWPLALDGPARPYPMTWMASWAGHMTYAHEMGHSFGLPHSSGPYGDVYDSRWDVMSGGGTWEMRDGAWEYIGVHTIGYHKDLLVWVPADRKFTAVYGTNETITLQRLVAPPSATGYLLAQIPIGDGRFYTVVARGFQGYDASGGLPGEGVVIHRVNPRSAGSHALVMDADNDGDVNDAGAIWTVGETFNDAGNDIWVQVEAATPTTFWVRIIRLAGRVFINDTLRSVAVRGQPYADTLQATGGAGPHQWSVPGGGLPPGLILDSSTGVLAGTPTDTGTFHFGVHVQTIWNGATRGYTVRVYEPVVIASDSLRRPGVVGTAYADTLVASGGTGSVTWAITGGALPPGLVLDAAGRVSGTPTDAGTFHYTATAISSLLSASRTFAVAVAPLLAITADSLRIGVAGSLYADTLRAGGGVGAYAWSISAGELPPGLRLDGSTGVVSGTPGAAGSFGVTLAVASGPYTDARSYTLRIYAPVVIASDSLRRQGVVGAEYADTLTASGGAGTITWTITGGALPPGLALDTAGRVAGTPTEAGTFHYTATATSSLLSASRTFAVAVAPLLAITADSLRIGVAGSLYADTLRAGGGVGAYAWSITAGELPPGLRLDGSTGVVSGTPGAAGSFGVTLAVASGPYTDARSYTLRIYAPVVIASDSLRRMGVVGTAYADTLVASGGAGSAAWTITGGALPPGLVLDAAGRVAGTPTQAGTFHYTATATSSLLSASRTFAVAVVPPVAIASDSIRPPGIMGSAYADSLAAAGGAGAVSWTVTQGRLPAGLTLNATGKVSGTVEEAGTFRYTAAAVAGPLNVARTFVITVEKPQIQAPAVLDQLLGTGSLTPDQLRFLDLLGNRNGRLDVGDVRAWLLDSGNASANGAAELWKVLDTIAPGGPSRPAGTHPAGEKEN